MTNPPTLAEYFAKLITSRHNQHAIVGINGAAGTGKSWYGLALSLAVAKEVARIKGGLPEDYFDVKNDLAVISRDEIRRVMNNPKRYTVKFLDDIGIAWNARKFKDEFNMFLNDLIQSFRPNNNLVILTVQYDFLMDKVPRSLMHYCIEMDNAWFDKGITSAKVFQLQYNGGMGKMFRHYLQHNGMTINRHVSKGIPEELAQAYEIERAAQLQKMKDGNEQTAAKSKEPKDLKKNRVPKVDYLINNKGWTQKEACEHHDITPQYYREIKEKEGNAPTVVIS